jgi:hypothetical protein
MLKSRAGSVPYRINGIEVILLNAAVFMLLHWDFKSSLALTIQKSVRKRKRKQAKDGILERRNHFFSIVRERNDTPRSQEAIDPRLLVEEDFYLTAEQMRITVLALEACHAEFSINASRWNDFIMASPGNLPSYGIVHEDLIKLSAKLKHQVRTQE